MAMYQPIASPIGSKGDGWGSLQEVLDAPPENVTWDGSWISVFGMWFCILPTIIQGVIGGLCSQAAVCMIRGACCIPGSTQCCSVVGYVLNGRPFLLAWTMWRAMLLALVALVAQGKSRLGLFLWERKSFGNGEFWWHGEGVWSGSYKDCDRILRGPQHRVQSFGAVLACTPELFPSKLLIFLPNDGGAESEWASVRKAVHQFFVDQGSAAYQKRREALPRLAAGEWKRPKLEDLSEKKLMRRLVAKCIFYMMFEVWVDDAEGDMLGNWRAYAGTFILPRLIQRMMCNRGLKKVKALRAQTVGLVEKYGKQGIFVRMNDSLGRWRRETPVQLCDEIMFGMGFAGTGGTCAAIDSVGAFLQVKLPSESPGQKYIHWGQYDTSEKMIAKYRQNPERFIRETLRMDPPVTSATSTLREETTTLLAGRPITLPKGLLNQYALSVANRDEELFPDAKVFNPDRANLEKALTWNGAFGAGDEGSYPRICPGRHLSLELTTMLVNHALSQSNSSGP